MRKPRLTIKEHIDLGVELKILDRCVSAVLIRLGHAYPYGEKITNLAGRLMHNVEDLRCIMDNAAGREHPTEFQTAWYYGGMREEGA